MTTQPRSRDKRLSFAAFTARAAARWQGRNEPLLRLGVALMLVATGVIHAGQITSHLDASRVAGLFFAGVAALQVGLGIALMRSASKHLRIVALAATVGTIAVWVASRSVGIPIGTEEPVGVADAVATGFELVTAVLVGALLLTASRPVAQDHRTAPRNAVGRYLTAVAMALTIAAVTAVALRPVPFDGHQHARDVAPPSVADHRLLQLLHDHGSHPSP